MSGNGAMVNDATSASEAVTPHSLVTEDNVRAALIADKGPSARLTEWKVVDFAMKGDNYASLVSSVEVKYELDGMSSEVEYVVKLNPCRKEDDLTKYLNSMIYEKEAKFYCNLVPALNAVLKENNQKEINFPKCLYVSLEKGKEVIYLEDLRPRGYIMHDVMRGMDTLHTNLVLRELGRLHAASLLLEKRYPEEDLTEKYPCLKKNWGDFMAESEQMQKFVKDSLKFTQEILKVVGGYERAVPWIDALNSKLKDVFFEQMECGKPKVVCHGDCWNNNLLFKYDEVGHPVDVILLDLQGARYTPPATDLSYFLYTSTTGDFRKLNLHACLECYHGALTDFMEAANNEVPFDLEQLSKDFKEKTLFGAIFALMAAPMAVMKSGERVSSKDTDENFLDKFENARARTMDTLDSNSLLRPRLLCVLDELMELGILT